MKGAYKRHHHQTPGKLKKSDSQFTAILKIGARAGNIFVFVVLYEKVRIYDSRVTCDTALESHASWLSKAVSHVTYYHTISSRFINLKF